MLWLDELLLQQYSFHTAAKPWKEIRFILTVAEPEIKTQLDDV